MNKFKAGDIVTIRSADEYPTTYLIIGSKLDMVMLWQFLPTEGRPFRWIHYSYFELVM